MNSVLLRMNTMRNTEVRETGQPLVVSAKELAALLGVSLRHVWRLNATGKLPKPVRLGGSVKWRRDEIIAWLSQNCPARSEWEAIRETLAGGRQNA